MTLQFPPSPTTGQTYPSPAIPGSPWWVWDGAKWSSRGLANAIVSTSAMPPLNPRVGDLWFDPNEGQLYVYFDDGSSQQWVVAINQGLNRPVNMGVTDGSSAQPGEVGEFVDSGIINISALPPDTTYFHNLISISLGAGDWDVTAWAWIYGSIDGSALSLTVEIGDINADNGNALNAQPYFRAQVFSNRAASATNGPKRFNLATATQMWAWILVGSGWLGGYAQIYARRMR